jgi:thiol-disulfide isomerase/thioredoxin/outer membrane lipoprotein-sorting protein
VATGQDLAREREILDQVSATYRAAERYHLAGIITVQSETQGRTQSIDVPFAIAGDGVRRRDEVTHPMLGMLLVSDGRQFSSYRSQSGEFTQRPGGFPNPDSLKPGELPGIATSMLTAFREIGNGITDLRPARLDTVIFDGQPRPCWVIAGTYPGAMGPTHKEFWIEQSTHRVLRQRTRAHLGPDDQTGVNQDETLNFAIVELNQPVADSLFTFRIPQGAKPAGSGLSLRAKAGPPDLSGKKAYDFTLKDLAGKPHTLSKMKGKVVMLDFWATWCGPCRMQMPRVEKLKNEFSGKGLVVFAVNQGENAETAYRYLKKFNYTTTTLLDADGKVGTQYQVAGIPSLVVIDRAGTISSHFVGLRDEETLRAALVKAGLK